MSCLPEVQGYSGIGTGRGADVAAPYNYGGNFKGLLVRCLNCNASRHRGGDPGMRISVRNAGRWFGPRSVGARHSTFPLARTNGPRLCDCAFENDRDLPVSEAREVIGRGARAGSLKSRVRARHRATLCADPLDAPGNVDELCHRAARPRYRRRFAVDQRRAQHSAQHGTDQPSPIPREQKFNSRSAARQNAPRSCR
jgi:hypothetical protein